MRTKTRFTAELRGERRKRMTCRRVRERMREVVSAAHHCTGYILSVLALGPTTLAMRLSAPRNLKGIDAMASIDLCIAGGGLALGKVDIRNSCKKFVLGTVERSVMLRDISILHISKEALSKLELLKPVDRDRREVRIAMTPSSSWLAIVLGVTRLWCTRRRRMLHVLKVAFEIGEALVFGTVRRALRCYHGY